MILSHIVAVSENNIIGEANTLPWNIPEDMEFFKEKTRGHILIVGRKTFDSLGKPLPKRFHIVITRSPQQNTTNVVYVGSLEAAIEIAQTLIPLWPKEVFVIGGGEIYKSSLPYVSKIYLTRIYQKITGDTTYPELDLSEFTVEEEKKGEGTVPYTFFTYLRKASPSLNRSLS